MDNHVIPEETEDVIKKEKNVHKKISAKDKIAICVLLFLYTLQGIPMGLCGSLPLLLKERGVSYESLSLFSLVSLPFSLKILWAPIIDTYYSSSFGRRKTWLVPIQLITGIVMIYQANAAQQLLDASTSLTSNGIRNLTFFFFFLYFLMASQDIVVDGWALTMLSKQSVGLASVCNSIGQSLGILVANQLFTLLSDSKLTHKYFNTDIDKPLLNLESFLKFWGWVFLISTILLWIFKSEEKVIFKQKNKEEDSKTPNEEDSEVEEVEESLSETIKQIYQVLKLPNMIKFLLILLTCKMFTSPIDGSINFILIENGVSRALLASLTPPAMIISGVILPSFIAKFISKSPLKGFIFGLTLKLFSISLLWLGLQYTIFLKKSSFFLDNNNEDIFSNNYFYYIFMLSIILLNDCSSSLTFISLMSFFNKISDPKIGGTFMTLLNTVSNWGSMWPKALGLWLIPRLTYKICEDTAQNSELCSVKIEGFTILTFICLGIGVLYVGLFHKQILNLQKKLNTNH